MPTNDANQVFRLPPANECRPEHAMPHTKLEKHVLQLEMLHEIDHAILNMEPRAVIMGTAVAYLRRLIPHQHTSITLHDLATNEIILITVNAVGKTGQTIYRDQSFEEISELQGLTRGEVILVDNLTHDLAVTPILEPLHRENACSVILAPLTLADKMLGVLALGSTAPATFSPEHIEIVQGVANQLAIAVSHMNLLEQAQRRADEMDALLNTSQIIAASLDLNTTLETIADKAERLLNVDGCRIHLLEPDNKMLRCVIARDANALQVMALPLKYDEGLVGKVAASGKGRMVDNVALCPDAVYIPDTPQQEAESLALAPLKVREQVIGVMTVSRAAPKRPFVRADFNLLATFAAQAAVAIENARLYSDLEQSLKQEQKMRSRLIQAGQLTTVGRLAATVAHELNNPLQIIYNVLYLVNEEEFLSEQAQQDLDLAMRETLRMRELLGRLRETYLPIQKTGKQPECLNELAAEVKQLIKRHLHEKRIHLKFKPTPDLPPVNIVRDQIKQIILNLSLNGVEAMPDGGELIFCTSYDPVNAEVFLSIIDSGRGIMPDDMPYLFEPFFTLKETGSGLGLSIADEIIEQHHGRIDVVSEVGRGSTFTIVLPYGS